MEKNKVYLLKSRSNIFDCIVKIKEILKMGVHVEVLHYLNRDFSKKEQYFHKQEILLLVELDNERAARILYGC